MTGLTLNVVSVDAAPPTQAFACRFDVNGGTIGRDESNSMPLPDKHRRVSRLHATVSFPGGVATITNSSASLPIAVGEQQLDSGESVPVAHGVTIEIGPYLLQAVLPGVTAVPATGAPRPQVSPLIQPPTQLPSQSAAAPVASMSAAPLATARELDLGALFPAPAAGAPVAMPLSSAGDDPLQALLAGAPVAIPTSVIGSAAAGNGSRIGHGLLEPSQMPAPPALGPSSAAATIGDFLTGAPAPAPASADPFANLLEGIGAPPGVFPSAGSSPAGTSVPAGLSADPLAALGGSVGAMPALPHSAPSGARIPAASSALGAASGATIPDDFNPFDLPSDVQRNSADPLAGLLGQPAGAAAQTATTQTHVAPPIDSLFQGAPGVSHDPLLAGTGALPVSNSADGLGILLGADSDDTDPLALFAPTQAPPPGHRPMRDDALELGAAFAPPVPQAVDELVRAPAPNPILPQDPFAGLIAAPLEPVRPAMPPPVLQSVAPAVAPPVAAPPVPPIPFGAFAPTPSATAPAVVQHVAPTPPAASSTDALTEAFLRGAGLPPSALPQGLTPEVMMMVGSVLRSATAGAVDMLAARAATKREVQASVTIISVQANNPLKFLPNADAAMLQLLGKKMPGFMRADVAMRDAFDDLRAHEVGVIAGTRAALTEVLGKFDPAVLGEKLARGSVLESLLPSARKAKLWDMYLERYLQIRREAEDDFQSIFGRAFVQAYERETARIKGETPAVGGER